MLEIEWANRHVPGPTIPARLSTPALGAHSWGWRWRVSNRFPPLSCVYTAPHTHHTHVWAISMLADNFTVWKVQVFHVFEILGVNHGLFASTIEVVEQKHDFVDDSEVEESASWKFGDFVISCNCFVVCLDDTFHIFCTTIRKFHTISIFEFCIQNTPQVTSAGCMKQVVNQTIIHRYKENTMKICLLQCI